MFNIRKNNENEKGLVIPLLPLRDVVVFPHMIVPLFVGRERSVNALESAMKFEKGIFLSAQEKMLKRTILRKMISTAWGRSASLSSS